MCTHIMNCTRTKRKNANSNLRIKRSNKNLVPMHFPDSIPGMMPRTFVPYLVKT